MVFEPQALNSQELCMYRFIFSLCVCLVLSLNQFALAQSITIDFEVFGLNKNQSQTDQTLENACTSINQSGAATAAAADLLNTCAILNPLDEEDAGLAAGLDRLIPEEAFAISDTLTDASDLQVTNVNARINALREQQSGSSNLLGIISIPGGGGSAGESRLENFEVFFNGQVSTGELDGKLLQQDADLTASQFTLGADYRLSDNLIVGVGVGLFQHETDFSNTAGDSQVDGTNLTLFGTYSRESLGYLDVVLDIGSNSFQFSRQINLEGSNTVLANASTDSSSVSLTAGVGKNYRLSGWDLGPYLRFGLTTASVDGYSERADSEQPGFGSTLRVDSQSINSTTFSIGGTASRAISTNRFVVVPQLSVEVELEADSDKDPLSASFLADPNQQVFTVDGEERDANYVNLGAGATAFFTGGKSAYAYYETRLAHEFITQHWFKLGARFEF